MKKFLFALLLGVALGGGGVWLKLNHHDDAKPEAAAAKPEEKPAGAGAGPTLSKEQQSSAGLDLASPKLASLPAEAKAYGRVLDPAPLVALATEIAAAQTALTSSEREFKRTKALHDQGENASAQAVELTEAAVLRDRVQLLSAKSKLAATWGKTLAAKADLAFLAEALASGWAFVRLDLPAGEAPAAAPVAARVGALTDESMLAEVELLGAAPAADAQMQGAGFLALWREHPLPPGTVLRATITLPGEPQKLLTLPRAAFVRHEGSAWVYVQTESGSYERRRVDLARPLADGFALTGGVAETDKVVIVGAQQLLSMEMQAAGGGEP